MQQTRQRATNNNNNNNNNNRYYQTARNTSLKQPTTMKFPITYKTHSYVFTICPPFQELNLEDVTRCVGLLRNDGGQDLPNWNAPSTFEDILHSRELYEERICRPIQKMLQRFRHENFVDYMADVFFDDRGFAHLTV
jgi:hypothetical protein